jgi:hypothetical protein
MKRAKFFAIFLLLSTLGMVVTTSLVSATIPDYFPDPDTVEGYDLFYENLITVENPLNDTAPPLQAGAQIWTQNQSSHVAAVVGVMIFQYSEDVFGKNIPRTIRTIMTLANSSYSDIKTYWDLLVFLVTQSPHVTDISGSISSVDGAIAITNGDQYLILSKDAEFLIFSFGFYISDLWYDFVLDHQEDVEIYFNLRMTVYGTILLVFQSLVSLFEIFEGEGIPNPVPSSNISKLAEPTGEPTDPADVRYVTAQIGSVLGGPNLLWIILGVLGAVIIVGGIVFMVRKRRK